MNKSNEMNVSESLPIGIQLAMAGGFIDAYTYVNRGNVFATGQTGNLVLIGIRFADKDYRGAVLAFIPIIFFVMGIFAYQHLKSRIKIEKKDNGPYYILLFEILILYLVGLLPSSAPNIIANASIGFASALQFCAFRTLVNGPYATVFCTGNIRSCAELYYKGLIQKDQEALKSAKRYTAVISSFLVGGMIAAWLSGYLAVKTIWVCCGFLLLPLVYMMRANGKILVQESN